jgi:hypothetical protein
VFRDKSCVRFSVIVADPDDFRTDPFELLVAVSKPTSFGSTTASEIFRIEVDDDVLFSPKIPEANIATIAID